MGKDPGRIRQQIEDTRERMGDTVDALGYRADVKSRVKEKISDTVGNIKGSISDKVEGVKSAVGGLGGRVSDRMPSGDDMRRSANQVVSAARENPIGLALGALALGFVAGLLVPTTRVEDEKIGPVADKVRRAASDTGREAMEHGKQVLQDVANSASESGQRHGQELASSVRDRAQSMSGQGNSGV
jgi:gas vesicle protein